MSTDSTIHGAYRPRRRRFGRGGPDGRCRGAEVGLRVLVIESAPTWGGSTAMSGGGLWSPNTPLLQREGVADSREEALDYLERTIGDNDPATSRKRKEAVT